MAPEEPIAEKAYDEMADTYDVVRESPDNADIEFPATTSLIPDVDGMRVLDAGCGSGVYAEWLVERGADVVGIDVSTEMLELARDVLGDRATFLRANLGGRSTPSNPAPSTASSVPWHAAMFGIGRNRFRPSNAS